MENINKKDFSRIYELMSFDRGKTLYEMEQKWDNILSEAQVPAGSYVRKEIENSAKSENINKTWAEIKQDFGSNGTETDNIKLYNAWVDGKWRPGAAVPSQYQTTTYKSKSNQVTTTTTTVLGQPVVTTTTTSTNIPGDKNNDGVVDSKDLAPDQKMNNSGKSNDTEDLDYDADAEGFEEEEPEMDREIDTTRKMEIKPSNNGWEDFFAKQFGK
jgi:hypothetical protein